MDIRNVRRDHQKMGAAPKNVLLRYFVAADN